jgi:hypothetical protein
MHVDERKIEMEMSSIVFISCFIVLSYLALFCLRGTIECVNVDYGSICMYLGFEI